jgi:DNA-binding transcriptional regulator YiaG
MTITPGQVIAARKMLNWSQSDLAAYVGATKASILAFESRERWPVDLDLDLIRAVFEDSGVEFIADLGGAPGVRLRKAGK